MASKEFAYFRGIMGANTSNTLVDPSETSAGSENRGGLLTTNAQFMRVAKGTNPEPQITVTSYGSSFTHPENTIVSSMTGTGTISANSNASGTTGRWVWFISDVSGFHSDFQMQTFDFKSGTGDYVGTPGNSSTVLDDYFERHSYNSSMVGAAVDTDQELAQFYQDKINLNDSTPFGQITVATTSARWNLDTGNTPSSNTGVTVTAYCVYYESSSSSHTPAISSFLRSQEITYSGVPQISFNYAMYTTSTYQSEVGKVRLKWIVED